MNKDLTRKIALPRKPDGTPVTLSWLEQNDPAFALEFMQNLTAWEAEILRYQWPFWARDKQLPPDDPDHSVWFIHAGRGFGKSRAAAEWVRGLMESGECRHMALVGANAGDVRDVMIYGTSGLITIAPPWARPVFTESRGELRWPNEGICRVYSAHDYEQLRGPEHDGAWTDEVAKWRYEDAWHQLMFGLRLGPRPKVCVTTTLRPKRWVKKILEADTTRSVGGSTSENAQFLSAAVLQGLYAKYQGTRLGRQELDGEYLDDTPGALWNYAMFETPEFRVAEAPKTLRRVVIAVDPAVTSHETSDETGITVCARDDRDHFYCLGDFSGRFTTDQWARKAVELYDSFKADCIVGEANNGGDLVEMAIKTAAEKAYLDGRRLTKEIPFHGVHASRGKVTRAQPVSMLYEQGRVHHVGNPSLLEDQMAQFTPEDVGALGFSPDRVDALVWGITEVMLDTGYKGFVF